MLICGRHEEPLRAVSDRARQQGLRGQVDHLVADIGNPADLERVLDAAEGRSTGLHGWVNNAYSGAGGRLGEATREELEQSIDSGLTQVILATQAVARRLARHRRGSIVNLSSMYGMVSPYPDVYREFPGFHNPPAYGAAKAGLIQFSRYAAVHLARSGIRVNCVSPGPFPGVVAQQEPGFISELELRVPLGRIGRPEELVGAIVFLLGDAASYVTGHNLVVDGGWSAW